MTVPRFTRLGHYLTEKLRNESPHYSRFKATSQSFLEKRLEFTISPKFRQDTRLVCANILQHFKGAVFYCDSSMFDSRTDPLLWETLLSADCKVIIISKVMTEIQEWLESNADHIMAQAITNGHPNISHGDISTTTQEFKSCFSYYVRLLWFRKNVAKLEAMKMNKAFKGDLTHEEWKVVRNTIQKEYGPRAYQLAKKENEPTKFWHLHTDETLIFIPFYHCITESKQVVILSKDEDIQEQFYKLQWILDTQYRALLFSDVYVHNFSTFKTYPFPSGNTALHDAFVENPDNILVEKPEGILQEVLPTSFTPVTAHCWILGDYYTEMEFTAEREMAKLFSVKAETCGLNTNLFHKRNCHIWLAPLNVGSLFEGCAVIAHDRCLKVGSILIPILDANQSIFCGEDFIHL